MVTAWEAAPAAPGRPACRCEKPAQGAAAPKTRTPGSAAHDVVDRAPHRSSVVPRSTAVSRNTRAEVPSANRSRILTRSFGRCSRRCRSSRAVSAKQPANARSAVGLLGHDLRTARRPDRTFHVLLPPDGQYQTYGPGAATVGGTG